MISTEPMIQWQLLFNEDEINGTSKFCFAANFGTQPEDSSRNANVLIEVPNNIVLPEYFYGLGKSPTTNWLCYELAEKISTRSFECRSGWTNWVNDFCQSGNAVRGSYEWLSLEDTGNNINTAQRPNICFALSYIFWKGLFIYFSREDCWRKMQARFLYLVAAWQWFHLSRKLAEGVLSSDHPKGESGNTQLPQIEHWVNNDLVEATHALQHIIADPENEYAVQLLLWYGRRNKGEAGSGAPTGMYEGSESLLLGMVLDSAELKSKSPKADQQKILPWLDWTVSDVRFINKNRALSGISWDTAGLHPVYYEKEKYHLRSFVRRLISRWLLPHYDFEGALNLAFRLKVNSTGGNRPLTLQRITPGIWIWVVTIAVSMAGLGLLIHPASAHPLGLVILACFFVFLLVLAPPLLLLLTNIERSVYQYLLLPRLLGGIAVGYSALVLESDSTRLAETLFAAGPGLGMMLWMLLLALTLVPGFWYLYYECYAIVGDKTIARKRATQIFSVALLSSAFMGLFTVALTTAMDWQDFGPVAGQWLLLGPIGWIDLHQYLVSVPLALLTGFLTQFIFEEKSITASIWQEK